MFFCKKIRGILTLMKESSSELKKTKSLTNLALLAALNIIMGSLFIELSSILRIGFSFIVVGVSAMLYGPVATGVVGVLADILKYMIRPSGVFFIGFTVNEFLSGFLSGLILYKKHVTIKRTFFARLVVMVTVNLILTPIWLSILYGKGIMIYVSARIVKNIILLPIETIVLYGILKKVETVKKITYKNNK
ncbi:MAG: folate family ECF transporter S component [Clostridium sp.]|uniref:folate family ECF transporter S component n=1 Tax=Clostridium sp. TaxID=1506 RepID=UPI003044A76E